ncbi:MAG: carboxypeptidase regulatory-like domain-containing protein [Gemmatimonadaceae bacterium]
MLLALGAFAGSGSAQVVRGTVRDQASRTPVSGALIALVGGPGEPRTVLSNEFGHFAVRAPSPGEYALDVKRIGVKRSLSAPFVLGDGETREMELLVAPLAAVIGAIEVRAQQRCATAPGGESAASIWEDTRAALLATRLTMGERHFEFTIDLYTRDVDPITLVEATSRRRRARATAVRPFRSVAAEELSRRGYVLSEGDTTAYRAPDAEVMLSDVFVRDHCFRIVANDSAPEEVGLAFEPAPRRRVADVRGTMWLDRRTHELRWLEFGYANVPASPWGERVGGRVEFSKLPNGGWVVRRWWVRMPLLTRSVDHPTSFIHQLREEGGEVIATELEGASRRLAALDGTLVDSTSGRPLADAVVTLAGTDFGAATDSLGRYHIDAVPAGRYDVTFAHARLASLGIHAPLTSVTLKEGALGSAELAVPALLTIAATLCPTRSPADPPIVVRGLVTDSAGTPLAGVPVRAVWVPDVAGAPATVQTITGANGEYLFCDVRSVRGLRVRVRPARGPERIAEIVRETGIITRDFELPH